LIAGWPVKGWLAIGHAAPGDCTNSIRCRHEIVGYETLVGTPALWPPIASSAALGSFPAAPSFFMTASLWASPSAHSFALPAVFSGSATSPTLGFSPAAISSSARRA
jgi:hypothetical protein